MHISKLGVICGLLAIANIFEGRIADAQFVSRPYYRRSGSGNLYGYNPASYANAMSNVIRAQAQADLTNQKTRSLYLDNQKKWAQNYFKMKEERQEYDARQKEKHKVSPETRAEVAKLNLPRELGPDALDPVTGHITWPTALQHAEYSAHRTELDRLFAQRVQTGQAAGTVESIHAVTKKFAHQLRQHIEEIPAKEFMSGRKFLDSLDYAAQSHAG
jgi:hypothetical protein